MNPAGSSFRRHQSASYRKNSKSQSFNWKLLSALMWQIVDEIEFRTHVIDFDAWYEVQINFIRLLAVFFQ